MKREQTRAPVFRTLLVLAIVALAAGCSKDETVSCTGDDPYITRPDNWTVHTHCRGVEADYEEVFDDGVVHEFRITIPAEQYAAMMDDMDTKFSGSFNSSPDLDELPIPMWAPATITYGENTWTNVGIRWKGHSSLKAAWNSGVRKLSFMLHFDHFEESFPNLENQRFYGLKKLIFSNAYNDPSIVREKVAYEVFRRAGVPVPHVAFAPVYLNYGSGWVYMGVYTMVEDPSDEMLEVAYGEHDDEVGNLYKPWGNAARWIDPEEADGGPSAWYDDITDHFEKGTNDDVSDWGDIADAIATLHKERAVPAQWRAELEEVFDVDAFLTSLAVNQVIMNWDSYGCMHHNYYVYSDPWNEGRFVWFPWDLNEAMLNRPQSGCPEPGSVFFEELFSGDEDIDTDWPLITFLLEDTEYRAQYKQKLQEVLDTAFVEADVTALIDEQHALIAPYVVGPTETEAYPYTNTTGDGFNGSLDEGDDALKPHVTARREAVAAALQEWRWRRDQ